MKRILVIGSGGAGKSTLARELGERLHLPVVHLDAYYWNPGWRPTAPDEWKRKVEQLAATPGWVMDGNYGGTLDARLAACDTVIFLDLPRIVCIWRIVTRWLRHRGRSRPDMAAECPEQLHTEFLWWVWTYRRRRRPDVLRKLAGLRNGQRAIVLTSRGEVDQFLGELRASAV